MITITLKQHIQIHEYSEVLPIQCIDSHGVTFAASLEIDIHVSQAQLIKLMPVYCKRFEGYQLCYPPQRLMAPALCCFIDFIRDVTSRDSFQSFAKYELARFDTIDVLINNAGIMPLSLVSAMMVDEWDKVIAVNVKGVLYRIVSVLATMTLNNAGQIINVSSNGGLVVSPTAIIYCAMKYAVRAISDGLRQESDF